MENRQILALGYFDGVHLGHGALLKCCRQMADRLGCQAGVVTFASHPDTLVLNRTPPLINSLEDRTRLMRELYGMDNVIALPFDRSLMAMPWQDFFEMLLDRFHAAGLVCGYNFHFGFRGAGNAALLQQVCCEAGLPCSVIPAQKVDGTPISSTCIRTLLEQGQMEQAVRMLGHPHVLTGTVIPGRHLGRTMGIPTANLVLPAGLVCPRFGVYACRAVVDGASYLAVTNIGTRPTVNGSHVTVEPWLLDFNGDLYGKELTLHFYAFLRPEKKFASLDALQAEIRKNAQQTRKLFKKS